ncbi:MAG: DUF805 domain-containing protein [Actinomycetota bacterium]
MDLFVGRGRVGRLEYLGTNVLLVIAAGVAYRLLGDRDVLTGDIDLTIEAMVSLGILGWLSLMNTVRRLHDRSHNGLLVVFALVPIANVILGLYLLVAPGSPGWNRYGARGVSGPASPLDTVVHAEALAAEAAARNEAFLDENGSFDMDGLFRESDIDRT